MHACNAVNRAVLRLDIVYDCLRKSESVIILPENKKLGDFLKQFYDIEIPDDAYDPERTILYSDGLDSKTAVAARCRYIWSGAGMTPETRMLLPEDSIIIEGKNIKDEYIARFLGNCSV